MDLSFIHRDRARNALSILLCGLTVAGCSSAPQPSTRAFDDLVAAERAFAASSRAHGMRAAFLEYLGPGSIVFRPGPTDGRQAFQEGPPAGGTLDWYPARAEVSFAGDLGYTTGPWEYKNDGNEPAFGHYVSVWRRQEDGVWRVALDIGIGHPRPSDWTADAVPRDSCAGGVTTGRGTPDELRGQLLERDRSLARLRQERGAVEAYRAVGADDLTLYRNGSAPAAGTAAVAQLAKGDIEVLESVPGGAGVAESGDLGYTFGTLRIRKGDAVESRGYARIWRNQGAGGSRLVIDVELPGPATT